MSLKIPCIACSIHLVLATTAFAEGPKESLVQLADRLLQRSPDGFTNDDLYVRMRKEITPSQYSVLSDDKYDSLIAHLAFDDCGSRVEQSNKEATIAASCAEFRRFFHDRFGVRAPKWWINRMAAIRAPDKQAVAWSFEDGPDFVRVIDLDVQIPTHVTFGIEGDKVVLTVNERSATFVRDDFKLPGLDFGRRIAVYATESRLFLAVYHDAPTAIQVYCVNVNDGSLLWRTTAKGIPRASIMGRPRQLVDLVTSDERLYVFGIESHGAFVEAFSLDDGKRVLRLAEVESGSAVK